MNDVIPDTNILVYYITDENTLQNKDQIALVKKSKKRFKEIQKESNVILTSVVLVELSNILKYKVGVEESTKILEKIIFNEKVRIETLNQDEAIEALTISKENDVKYTDCLIYLISKRLNAKIFSYDKDFERFEDVELV